MPELKEITRRGHDAVLDGDIVLARDILANAEQLPRRHSNDAREIARLRSAVAKASRPAVRRMGWLRWLGSTRNVRIVMVTVLLGVLGFVAWQNNWLGIRSKSKPEPLAPEILNALMADLFKASLQSSVAEVSDDEIAALYVTGHGNQLSPRIASALSQIQSGGGGTLTREQVVAKLAEEPNLLEYSLNAVAMRGNLEKLEDPMEFMQAFTNRIAAEFLSQVPPERRKAAEKMLANASYRFDGTRGSIGLETPSGSKHAIDVVKGASGWEVRISAEDRALIEKYREQSAANKK